jgi:hypothetical protein
MSGGTLVDVEIICILNSEKWFEMCDDSGELDGGFGFVVDDCVKEYQRAMERKREEDGWRRHI